MFRDDTRDKVVHNLREFAYALSRDSSGEALTKYLVKSNTCLDFS